MVSIDIPPQIDARYPQASICQLENYVVDVLELSEDICHLKVARNMWKRNSMSLKRLTIKWQATSICFLRVMEDGISSNVDNTCVICMKRSRIMLRKPKLR
ncbi:hypothetical protein F511_47632 [Dorcoceras hygrometricum]|uniref:Uncharacterized protein n=1 Tax=Dorcoceras hygrometricum TaxID=472368 RepID=A0A2Z6ZWY6_9LAMI|nr:hypothetical protein F511_47632 [Dorcoceras hygrometricum]